MKKYLPHLIASIILFSPFIIFAASGSTGYTIKNPLGDSNTSVDAIMLKVMKIVAVLGGIVVVFFIIFSGFKFVTASGNPEALKKAKDMFFATVIGGAILLGAGIIANIAVNTINSIKN